MKKQVNELQFFASLENGEVVAAMLPDADEMKRWIAIFPFKVDPETGMSILTGNSPWRYRIRCFGIPIDFDWIKYDLHEEYIQNYENTVVDQQKDLIEVVSRWLDDLANLSRANAAKCPIC